MTADIRGIVPIVYTPFDAGGRVDEEDLARLVEHLLAAGAHGLAACGTASEAHKLTIAERQWLAERVVAHTNGRVPVIVGTSATNTAESVELSRHAAAIGAAAVFLTPPLFGAVTPATTRAHFGTLAVATDMPIMVQDAQVAVAPALIARLAAEFPTIRYAKEEAPLDAGHRISELRQIAPDVAILSGGAHLLDELARGAQGAIPGSIGIADLVRAYEAFAAGDQQTARAAFDHFTPLSFWRQSFPLLGAKEVLRRQGIFKAAHLRPPIESHLDEADHRELSALIARMGSPY